MTRIPLSSFGAIPLTVDTREALLASGAEPATLADMTEMAGQSVLAMRHGMDAERDGAPACYQSGYDPGAVLCGGCVFMPRCWRADLGYLRRLQAGKVPAPSGVPESVVKARMGHADDLPPVPTAPKRAKAPRTPPKAGKRPPPPPPPRRG